MLKTGFYRPPTTGSAEYSDAPYRPRSVQVIFLASRAYVIVGSVLLRPKRGEAIASVLFAFTATGLIALLYNLNPFNSWALLVGVWASSEALILYLLQNQRRNEKKFQKHPVSFPNPEGGGILGEYVNRPWHNELAELGRRYPSKKAKKKKKD